MKHGSNSRRGRSRGNGKRHSSPRNQTFDSNGPEGKVRGTPQQILDKYLSLARDAASAGEHIAAEGFYQFAEHYFRILNADQQHRQRMAEAQQNAEDAEDEANESSSDDDESNEDQGGDAQEASQHDDRESEPRKPRGNGRRRNGGDRKAAEASSDEGVDAGDATPADNAPGDDGEAVPAEVATSA